jgi:hypothetical protein
VSQSLLIIGICAVLVELSDFAGAVRDFFVLVRGSSFSR